MDRLRSLCSACLLACVTAALLCGCPSSTTPSAARLSKAEYFKQRQVPTVTTHGKIQMETVEEVEGKIQYKTDDGRTWRVEMTRMADDTYRYGTPEEVRK